MRKALRFVRPLLGMQGEWKAALRILPCGIQRAAQCKEEAPVDAWSKQTGRDEYLWTSLLSEKIRQQGSVGLIHDKRGKEL